MSVASCSGASPRYLARMASVEATAVDVVVDEIGAGVTGPRVTGLTGVTLQDAPPVCHECIWWQTREGRSADKRKWIEKAETEWGPWGTVYYDADGRVLGSMQYGPAELFPRAAELPAGPPSDDAVLVTCAYLVEQSSPWVMQSLFLAAIGDARDRGAKALETFCVPLPGGRVAVRALPGAQDDLPVRLPRGLRLSRRFAPPASSSLRGWSSAGSFPSTRDGARRCCGP